MASDTAAHEGHGTASTAVSEQGTAKHGAATKAGGRDAAAPDFVKVAAESPFSSTASTQDAESQRQHERKEFSALLDVHEINSSGQVCTPQPCQTGDLSTGGVGFHSRRMYNEGTQLIMVLRLPSGKRKLLFGVVKNNRYEGNAKYWVGAAFTPPIQTKPVLDWLTRNMVE